ncbi:GNAT family N-acetyltransferase [Sulfitobacter donghicola]|uniref:N-acetyltransferase GCN5 n=1 Tax=Sulfitobacter donghicola DSW-25 = KCTC 12864 = JCM 14565 TaxID=1300350 RepID=A0A073IM91_9RHOB|nr:GNAT family N-acetyltransferase [Sulfitobacter donghicola]KEJ90869.1 N-acetyltransferase GCN5 [Sulfitobacter donghicola DSW-25 = KCTC 12864 = JCM 14565]KIN68148.1 Acetyltransferase [Sulfitobacter donghicola DSW-25 = KCTC 12864 = JCM 14565]
MLTDGFHPVPKGKLAMVVTHLEMHAPATIKDVPLPDGISFRAVKPTLEWYRDVFTRVGALEWLWFGRLKMSDAELQAILDDPNVSFFTLSKDGVDEALLELDFRADGECELAYFGLTPNLIGTGAGRYLMDQAITQAWAQNIKRFHVHTCTLDSAQALNFYIRSGFTAYKREIEVDDDPRLTGVLPANAAAGVPII